MRHTLYLIAGLLLGTVLANLLLAENGYVAVSLGGWLVEMSVPTALFVIVLVYLALRLIVRLLRLPRILAAEAEARRHKRARDDLHAGLLQMASGHVSESEDLFSRSARDSEAPTAHYLLAARAASLQNDTKRRDAWLSLAREAAGDQLEPVLITQAEMLLARKQVEAARAALTELERVGGLGPRGLLLLARVHRQRGDHDALRALEPKLRSARGIPPDAINEVMDQLYLDMLRAATDANDPARVEAIWDEATKQATRRPDVVVAYARALARFGRAPDATKVLAKLLEETWSESAVLAYGEFDGGDPLEQLRVAEGWLRSRRDDPALLTACARLSTRAELYGKAIGYLEASVGIKPRADTLQLLADLHEQLGDTDRAAAARRRGLELAVGKASNLPRIRSRRQGWPAR